MRKSVDFEINLLPVISLLAVCISFLLLTAVWIHLGSLDVSQAVGTETDKRPSSSLWVEFKKGGDVSIEVKGAKELSQRLRKVRVKGRAGQIHWSQFSKVTQSVKNNVPQLNMALLMPHPRSSYDDIIHMIDEFKKINIKDVGVAPL